MNNLHGYPFQSSSSQGQVDFFWGAPGHVIRIFHDTHVTSPEYLQIALWTLDLQIHALNSLTSGPRA